MRTYQIGMILMATFVAGTGCQGTPHRRTLASTEPGLSSSPDSRSALAETPPARSNSFADRHPLFTKPRDYYENSGNNKLVKTAAATVIGIPAGIVGELRQIVAGTPPTGSF